MKSTGTGLFLLGAVLGAIALIWGRVGFYASQLPILFILAVGGVVLMAVGAKLNKDKNPNKSVAWKPEAVVADELAAGVAAPVVVAPAPVPESAPAARGVGAAPATAVDEATRMVGRGIQRSWTLTDAAGMRHVVGSRALLGRDPVQVEAAAAMLIALAAEDGSVSKTHAVVRVDASGLWVSDLGSTNGTVVVLPDGTELDVPSGHEIAVPAGSTLELGTLPLVVSASGQE